MRNIFLCNTKNMLNYRSQRYSMASFMKLLLSQLFLRHLWETWPPFVQRRSAQPASFPTLVITDQSAHFSQLYGIVTVAITMLFLCRSDRQFFGLRSATVMMRLCNCFISPTLPFTCFCTHTNRFALDDPHLYYHISIYQEIYCYPSSPNRRR